MLLQMFQFLFTGWDGFTGLHVCLILMGSLVYVVDKGQEQWRKRQSKDRVFSIWTYLTTYATWASFLAGTFLAVLAAGAALGGLPADSNPWITAVIGGMAAYLGASHTRKRMLAKQYKDQTSD